MFDGSLADEDGAVSALGDGQSAIVNFTGVTINSSLRIYCGATSGLVKVTVNGAESDLISTNTYGWYPLTLDSTPASLDQIRLTSSNPRVMAIEVDGKILVDPGSMGSNGFYLPFDPAAEGVIYISGS